MPDITPVNQDLVKEEIAHIRENLSALKANVETLSIDCRALNTSTHNAMMSLGILKEKLDSLVKDTEGDTQEQATKIEKALELYKDKIADCKQLCGTRFAALDAWVTQVNTTMTSQGSSLESSMTTVTDKLEKRIVELENLKSNFLWGALITVVGYLIKLLYPQLG